jgi:hypothetical protein
MKDSYDFETPSAERCAQLGAAEYDYLTQAKIKIAVFKAMIQRIMKIPKSGYFQTASNSHDFGTYYTLRFIYDDNDDDAIDFITEVDSIENWDRQALQELQEAGYNMKLFIDDDRLFKAPAETDTERIPAKQHKGGKAEEIEFYRSELTTIFEEDEVDDLLNIFFN